nr:FAD-binding oxidoreductase [Donghicola tyrosinivorans]
MPFPFSFSAKYQVKETEQIRGKSRMGPRPFMPDTLPVIAASPKQENVVLAFGHGQVGQTLGATTGKLVAELVSGRAPSIDLSPYAPDRF